ncbi:hypothetical protein [Vibrio tasmaniensis]|uniref:hypothetical protein n=1 Tax=Vibrio tasmaniensis TaxID=212663 RepID=UPI001080DF96|nr:hypothetical protein [Vibrio tasmaniensis]
MKSVLSFLSKCKVELSISLAAFLYFTFLFDISVDFAKSKFCSFEVSNKTYSEIVAGSLEFEEIKVLAAALMSDDGQIDICEASELQRAYDELTSPKAKLLEVL